MWARFEYRLRMQNAETPQRSLLGQNGVADLLILLLERGEITASQLRLVNRNYAKIAEVARGLEEAGLISVRTERSPRLAHLYKLTSKGKKVAEKLREAKELVGE